MLLHSAFAAFALLLVLAPGPDFAVVMKNALVGGRRSGRWTSVGVSASNAVQGTAAALGVGALVVASQPLFEAATPDARSADRSRPAASPGRRAGTAES